MNQTTSNSILTEPFFFHYNRGRSANMPAPHIHESYEIYYLISGQRRYFIENEIYDIYPGDIILIPGMKPHKVWNTPTVSVKEHHERFLLCPKKEEIPDIFLPCFDTHFYHLTDEANAIILECFQSLRANSSIHDAYTSYYNHANLTKILCTLARLPIAAKHTKQFSKNDQIIQDATLYIQNNCSQQLKLADMADKYFLSKEYFSTIFKETTGFGFNEYLNQMRISKAIELLNTTSLSIIEISAACGFNDSNYFSTVFKKLMGGPPNKFRPKRNK